MFCETNNIMHNILHIQIGYKNIPHCTNIVMDMNNIMFGLFIQKFQKILT